MVLVPWLDARCILCLNSPRPDDPLTARSLAHVIPQSIGGKLSAKFLCKNCNNRMGQHEALLAQDISIRLLLDKVEGDLPATVIKTIRNRQRYFADHPELGRVEAVMNNQGSLPLRQTEQIKGDRDTLRQALSELDRLDAGEIRKAELKGAFENAQPGEWVGVRPGYRIQKHIDLAGVDFKPNLDDPIAPLQASTGIAYLYLALCLRDRVYEAGLQPVRDALLAALDGNTAAADAYNLNRHGTQVVGPEHRLRAKPEVDGTTVTVQLFRDLVWPVQFPGPNNPEQTLYVLDLATGTSMWMSKGPAAS